MLGLINKRGILCENNSVLKKIKLLSDLLSYDTHNLEVTSTIIFLPKI